MGSAKRAKIFETDEQFVLNVAATAGDPLLSQRSKWTGTHTKSRIRARRAFEELLTTWERAGMLKKVAEALAEQDQGLIKCRRLRIDNLVQNSLVARREEKRTERSGNESSKKVTVHIDAFDNPHCVTMPMDLLPRIDAQAQHSKPKKILTLLPNKELGDVPLKRFAAEKKEVDLNVLLATWKARCPSVPISSLTKFLEMLHRHKPLLDYNTLATSGRQIIHVGYYRYSYGCVKLLFFFFHVFLCIIFSWTRMTRRR